ncbi:MAG: hypothetical protein ACRDM8_02350 [Gaiellaceae bacterium]
MTTFRWERFGALAGIAYVVLFLIAIAVSGEGAGDTNAEITRYYADEGNRNKDIAGFFLLIAAALMFIWFLAYLRVRLLRSEAEPGRLSALAFGSGLASAVLLMAAAAVFVAPAGAVENVESDSGFVLDPNTVQVLGGLGYGFFVGSVMVASLLVFATSLLALRLLAFPRWMGYAGFVVAPLLLLAILFFPVFVLWGWVLAVSAFMLWRPVPIEPGETLRPPNPPSAAA